MNTSRRRRFRVSRDTILFVAGLGGIAYQTLIEAEAQLPLLLLFGAMVGLPAFLRTDEHRQASSSSGEATPKAGGSS